MYANFSHSFLSFQVISIWKLVRETKFLVHLPPNRCPSYVLYKIPLTQPKFLLAQLALRSGRAFKVSLNEKYKMLSEILMLNKARYIIGHLLWHGHLIKFNKKLAVLRHHLLTKSPSFWVLFWHGDPNHIQKLSGPRGGRLYLILAP